MENTLPQAASAALIAAGESLGKVKALIGLDGFVDIIIHVVAQRLSGTEYTRLPKMAEFASKIHAAAGLSANFEFVSQMVKLGGNGPIMANALGSYGPQITYLGTLGEPALHPVFSDFSKTARVISVGEPGYTDAIEFEDGKLMCGKYDSLLKLNWEVLLAHLSEEEIVELFQQSDFIALVNWTMIPFMSSIWEKLTTHVAPKLTGEKRWLFFDLADPAKRTSEDIAEALRLISGFQKYFRVILGLNLQESRQIGEVLGILAPGGSPEQVTAHASQILERLQIETVVIHPTAFAAAADATGCTYVSGPYTEKPKITTGAGDHFNAGFCTGRLVGADLATSLQIGVATSGFYVREAKSPTLKDITGFLRTH